MPLSSKTRTSTSYQQLLTAGALVWLLSTNSAQAQSAEPSDPLPGPEITQNTVDMQANSQGPCLLQSSGQLFCWVGRASANSVAPEYRIDFQALNGALNNDIAEFSLAAYDGSACAIGKQSGVACVDDAQNEYSQTLLNDIPEPNAQYIALSKLDLSSNICGIQADNRVVCWGKSEAISNIPEKARYLKQVDLNNNMACGVDLSDRLVCWGETLLENDQNQQFGDEDLSTLGTIKQVALGPYAACVIMNDDSLRCFGAMSNYTEQFADKSFKSIDLLYTRGHSVCFEELAGNKECMRDDFINETDVGFASLLSPGTDPRLIWAIGKLYQIDQDNGFIQYYLGLYPSDPQTLFPSTPTGLRSAVYSSNTLELFWDRASTYYLDSANVSGYEIYQGDQLIDQTGIVTSYLIEDLVNASETRFSVRPVRGAVAGIAASIGTNGEPQQPGLNTPGNLRGDVYSTTALEIFFDRLPGSGVLYEISRNGVIIQPGQSGNSFFNSSLQAGTDYLYSVRSIINYIKSDAATITLRTRGQNGNASSMTTPLFSSGVRYSNSAVEVFWQRAPGASGIIGYELSRNGEAVKTLDGASYFDSSAPSGTTWTYQIVAIDAQGNRSAAASLSID